MCEGGEGVRVCVCEGGEGVCVCEGGEGVRVCVDTTKCSSIYVHAQISL